MMRLALVAAILSGVLVWGALPTWAQAASQPTESQEPQIAEQVKQTWDSSKPPVQQVLEAGLMTGYPDGKFHPEGKLTRAELAHILVKTFKIDARQPQNFDPSLQMADVPPGHWAYNDIKTVLRADVMEGYRPGRFYPNQQVTRAEGFAIVAQAYGVFSLEDAAVAEALAPYPDAGELPDWSRKAWATALNEGFVNADRFTSRVYPQQMMTRGDMAYALSKYLERVYNKSNP